MGERGWAVCDVYLSGSGRQALNSVCVCLTRRKGGAASETRPLGELRRDETRRDSRARVVRRFRC
jgi:hypothetical protein